MDMTPIANQEELSTAAGGACDGPTDAVGKTGLAAMIDFALICLYWSLAFMR